MAIISYKNIWDVYIYWSPDLKLTMLIKDTLFQNEPQLSAIAVEDPGDVSI